MLSNKIFVIMNVHDKTLHVFFQILFNFAALLRLSIAAFFSVFEF